MSNAIVKSIAREAIRFLSRGISSFELYGVKFTCERTQGNQYAIQSCDKGGVYTVAHVSMP